MNCLEFRRLALVDPRRTSEEARSHALECAACREVLEKQREADDQLFSALQVPVPDGLADRILVSRDHRPARRRFAWAMAATVLLTAGLGLLARRYFAADPLGMEAIQHVAGEPQSFTDIQAVGADFLPAVLAEQGIRTIAAIGPVSYQRLCPMDGRTARHVVVRTPAGPVTLFFMADDPTWRRRYVTRADGMAAVTRPASKGSLAIVASSLAQAESVERSFQFT
jgi:hypothetical protein